MNSLLTIIQKLKDFLVLVSATSPRLLQTRSYVDQTAWKSKAKISRGRILMRWADAVKKATGATLQANIPNAQNRTAWRAVVARTTQSRMIANPIP